MTRPHHNYADLGEQYATPQQPTPVSRPAWLAFNTELADTLNWPAAYRQTEQGLAVLSGNATLADTQPIATVYAGHQFGSYNPRLGDGRAILLGEWESATGHLMDVQLKGAGQTPFSRGGDGRSPVGPVVREFLVSEAMYALGVPTTRALAAISTGDRVYREVPEPGAVLTRVASSHLRIGTIQYFAMSKDGEGLAPLVDYVVDRHYPEEAARLRRQQPALPSAVVLLHAYGPRLAELVSHWQVLGFVHGVLNTDNMLLCGETVDYGPCALMDHFDPQAKYSAIDSQGRYAWPNQPAIAHWNFSVLAQCLLPLLDTDKEQALALAQAAVDAFPGQYNTAYSARLAARFGLDELKPGDQALIDGFYEVLARERLDHTLATRWLAEVASDSLDDGPLPQLFSPPDALTDWLSEWRTRRDQITGDLTGLNHVMRDQCPCVIPRNHQVAAAIEAAEGDDASVMQSLHQRWQQPYQWLPGDAQLAAPPQPEERVHRTFCGT